MKDMKLSKAERSPETAPAAAMPMKEEYPYGLRLRLGPEELKKLGFEKLPTVGTVFTLEAKATVESISAHEGKEYQDATVELQITELDCEEDGEEKAGKMAKTMFPTMYKK